MKPVCLSGEWPRLKLSAPSDSHLRWKGVIKRRVYKVRGANALWHHDGNEKLRPWGFYVHGAIDGHSRLLLYLACASNKRSATVKALFSTAVNQYEWPSRVRGDFGQENNGVEDMMQKHWGEAHHAYLRGRFAIESLRMRNPTLTPIYPQINTQCSYRKNLEGCAQGLFGNIPADLSAP